MPSQPVHSDHNEAAVSRAVANSTAGGKAIQAKRLSVSSLAFYSPLQKAPLPEETKPVQGKFVNQLQGLDEEELPVQGRFMLQKAAVPEEEEIVQGRFVNQLQGIDEEELPVQGRFILQKAALPEEEAIQQKAYVPTNNTGLPDNLKSGIENLSGFAMDDVKVHYNSDKPAQLNAHAYAQGTDIHIAPGQEKHLPHEAWHVVQQKQGRVQATMQMRGGVGVNDDAGLEREADVMGSMALQLPEAKGQSQMQKKVNNEPQAGGMHEYNTINFKTFSKNRENTVQLERKRTEDEESIENHSSHTIQRIVDETVPINSRIKIDSESASDYGDTGIIRRASRVKPKCMAVEFDNEPGVLYRVYFHEMSVVESAIKDLLYSGLMFTLNQELTEEYEQNVYDVSGEGLGNPTKVMNEGRNIYYDLEGERWLPEMAGEDQDLPKDLKVKLNYIAIKNYGERCHEVAEEMQNAFEDQGYKSVVYEIFTKDAPKDWDHISIMGARVRNHYVNVLNERAYDSSTGGHGVPWGDYLSALQRANVDRTLQFKKAD